MNRAPVNFLKHVFDGSIEDLANIMVAEADENKEKIKFYLKCVKEQIEEWTKELENDTN